MSGSLHTAAARVRLRETVRKWDQRMIYRRNRPNIRVAVAQPEDAEAFLALRRQLAQESQFLLLEADEINCDVERQRALLSEFARDDSLTTILLAFCDEKVIGYLGYRSSPLRRSRHVVRDVVIGVLEKYQRRGAAQRMFELAERQWIASGKTVVRLSVIEGNTKAPALYQKLGFEIEGVENKSLRIGGAYVDQTLMWKPIPERPK